MEFNDFCNEIRDNIGEYLLGYDFDNIQLQEVTHNNNTTHMGLLISQSEVNVAPTIYMEQYYKQYQDTGDMDAVIKEIAETYKASLESTNDLRTEMEVNKFVVSDTEFLSNSIYHIDKDSREIKMELPDPQIDDRQNQRGI